MTVPVSQKLFIEGPAGRLETLLVQPDTASSRGLAVIAHPHPQYGGTMHNKVVHTLFKALSESGFTTVRFNFRGVENSTGSYDNGVGETEDVLAVVATVRQQPDTGLQELPLVLAGFSFGGGIQAHAARQLSPSRLILVAPSVTHLSAPPVNHHATTTLIIHGSEDEIIPLQTVLDWAAPQDLPVVVIPGAGHFFHQRLPVLKQVVLDACRP